MELIIVLTLLAILSAAVAPVFQGSYSKLESDHAVRDLVATLKYAQERAITDTAEYRVYLNPETNEYWLMRLAQRRNNKKMFEPLAERQGKRVALPDRLRMNRVKARKDRETKAYFISFYPNGACDHAGMKLEQTGERSITIELTGSLGEMKVDEK
jgi:type II secretory pathway pseudopilin PulG